MILAVLLIGHSPVDAANNISDYAFQIAKQLKVPAVDALAAFSALKGRGIIPQGASPSAPVTSQMAQAIASGLIKAGQKPAAAARMLAFSAAAAAVPIRVSVEGAVGAAHAAGADIRAVTQAATEGAIQGAVAQVAGPMTKGKFLQRFFINKATRVPEAAPYLPKGVGALSLAQGYAAVVEQLSSKGEKALLGSKPEDPLTRADYITLSYLLAGGKPGENFASKKVFLKKKGIINPADIGLIKSFQGDVTLTRKGEKEGKQITGTEPVFFKDIDETELESRLELLLDEGTVITISEDTALTIDELIYNPKTKLRSVKLRVRSGTLRIRTAKNTNPKSKFEIITPTIVAGVRGTEPIIIVDSAGGTQVISNAGANEGNVSTRAVSQADRPPPPVNPPPGPPRQLPATPADVPPPVTVTPGNSSSKSVTQAAPSAPAPPPPAQIAAANAATTITNPAPLQPVKVTGAAASAAAKETATAAVTTAQAVGANVAAAAEGSASGAVVAAKEAGVDPADAGRAASQGAVGAAAATGADVAAVARGVGSGVVGAAQAVGADVGKVSQGASTGAMISAQAAGVDVGTVAQGLGNGAVKAAQESGANVGTVAKGVGVGTSQGAQVIGADPGAAARGAAKGAVDAASASGADVGAAARGSASGAVDGAQGLGGDAGAAAQGAATGAVNAVTDAVKATGGDAAAAAQAVTQIGQAITRAVIQVAASEGADLSAVTKGAATGAVNAVTDAVKAAGGDAAAVAQAATQIGQAITRAVIQVAASEGADLSAVAKGAATGVVRAIVVAVKSAGGDANAVSQAATQMAKATATAASEAAQAVGVNVVKVVAASTQGTVKGAQVAGADASTVNQIAKQGSLQVASVTGAQLRAETSQASREPSSLTIDNSSAQQTNVTGQEKKDFGERTNEVAETGAGTLTAKNTPATVLSTSPGAGLKPSAYTVNGGYQAGQLHPTAAGGSGSGLISVSGETAALNADSFLSLAVQAEEDILNTAAIEIRNVSSGSFVGKNLKALVDDQLGLSTIRARDAALAAAADARAGRVFTASNGDRVRTQQYVYRPPSNSDEVRMTSISLTESTGLAYLDQRVTFQSNELNGLSSTQIRDLPWNSYFTYVYSFADCTYNCGVRIGSPAGSPLLDSVLMEMGNAKERYIRDEILSLGSRSSGSIRLGFDFAGNEVKGSASSYSYQVPGSLRLTVGYKKTANPAVRTVSNPASFRAHAGSTRDTGQDISSAEFRPIPRQFLRQGVSSIPAAPTDRPDYFTYVTKFSGTTWHYPITIAVVGDATTSLKTGLQSGTCGAGGATGCSTLGFDNIWSAFRLNAASSANNPDGLPNINIGANILQLQAESGFANSPIRTFIIPLPRMLWKGETEFP